MAKERILLVEDEKLIRWSLANRLTKEGYAVAEVDRGSDALKALEEQEIDLILLDYRLPDMDGLQLLKIVGPKFRDLPVIMMTAHGTIDTAVEALKRGARDFLTKPLDYPKLKEVLDELVAEARHREAQHHLEETLAKGPGLGALVGGSRPMRDLFRTIKVLANSDAAALITGESGTGKELVARAIHDLGSHAGGPFIAVNAAAIPEGLVESELFGHERGAFTGAVASRAGCFEMADNGTLFLDEVAEMPVSLQPKILRALETGTVRRLGSSQESSFAVRVLAATNRDPEEAVREGRLRADLFYRLNVFTVFLPPLRDRAEDLPLLAQHFVGQFNRRHGTTVEGPGPVALELLRGYRWPGNVRELRNVMERAVILAGAGWIEAAHLPPYLRKPSAGAGLDLHPGLTLAEAERLLIIETLKATGRNKAEAARRLGVDVKTLRKKLRSGEGDLPE
ncbi:MAG: hypothetical protein B7X11_00445 [Acidobacteria bacterium 37-65-4]|nr:MAG: hypothetical protein B7X11_00445 [Acidobacteria bacterium 37-65-4]